MIYRLFIILLGIQCLCSSVRAEEKLTAQDSVSSIKDEIASLLKDIKNPFIPPPLPVPPEPPSVEPPKPPVPPPVVVTPTPPPQRPAPKPVDLSALHLTLSGMVWGTKPQAIINDQVVGIGEQIEGAKVILINQNGVEISYQGVKINLTIDGDMNKVSSPKKHNQKVKNPSRRKK